MKGGFYVSKKQKPELYRRVGDRLREIRVSQGLSQEKFAFQLGLSRNGYQQLEQGKHLPSFILMLCLEKVYKADFQSLYPYAVQLQEARRAQKEQREKERKQHAANKASQGSVPSD